MSNRYRSPVLLKLSGDCLAQPPLLDSITDQLLHARRRGTHIAVVVGGGNFIRGRHADHADRLAADRAGMLATIINGIRLTDLLSRRLPVWHLAAFGIPGIVERYTVELAQQKMADGRTLIMSGGTGNPFFSTDSAAALRAAELGASTLMKGTRVRGVFSADPEKTSDARFYPRLSYARALAEGLEVMDPAAFALCMEHRIPIVVFDISRPNAIIDIIAGKRIGSRVC